MNQPTASNSGGSTAVPIATESTAYVLCHACDYDLTGGMLDDGRLTCPECGYRQSPTPTAQWAPAGVRLGLMVAPLVASAVVAVLGYVIAATPLAILGLAMMLVTAVCSPLFVTWLTLRRGFASERRVASVDRLMALGLLANTSLLAVATFAAWQVLRNFH